MSSAYLPGMIARLVTALAILAFSLVTTVSSAHAARMDMRSGPDHAMHVGEMTHSPESVELACDGDQHCGSADAELCKLVCAGLSALLTSSDEESGHHDRPASHDIPTKSSHVSRAPGLNERPPKLRLL